MKAFIDQPFDQRHAGCLAEMAGKGATAHGDALCQVVDAVCPVEVVAKVVEQDVELRILGGRGYRLFNELGLATLAVRRYNHGARHLVGHAGAVIFAHGNPPAKRARLEVEFST